MSLIKFLVNLVRVVFLKEINTLIQQECVKLTKSDSKVIYKVTKHSYFK